MNEDDFKLWFNRKALIDKRSIKNVDLFVNKMKEIFDFDLNIAAETFFTRYRNDETDKSFCNYYNKFKDEYRYLHCDGENRIDSYKRVFNTQNVIEIDWDIIDIQFDI